MTPKASGRIDALLTENRVFNPPPSFTADANVPAQPEVADRIAFWEDAARRLEWAEPWHTAHSWTPAEPTGELDDDGEPVLSVPAIEWFSGGRLNVAVNCVDRHVRAGRGDKVALHFEGEPGDRRSVTYAELQREVSRAANALTGLGIGKGDRVVIYLPVLVETIVITLAVARIGAIHSLVFGGFSAEALKFRVEDTQAKLLVTTDGQFRRGVAVPVKANADEAVSGSNSIEHVLVVRRTGSDINWTEGRDVWWHDVVDSAPDVHEPEAFDAETPLFIIYTSGTTGKPKGLVHTSGGYLTQASWSHWAVFDVKDDDVYWCTADLAWVTAHTYEIYGPLSNGTTQVIYEGTPNTPHRGRHFEIIERYGVNIYYTAPTLIRTFMNWFPDGVDGHDLSSIRLLGSVGESINPEAWMWFRQNIGAGSAPIVDTWWQSETGAAVISPLPGVTALKPGSATRPLPGLAALVVDESGEEVPLGSGGYLVISEHGPAMARTVWGNPQRYLDSYWRRFADRGYFFAGDGAKYDDDGYIWLLGRVDDVINVSGHRLSTIEIESALVSHPWVTEAGVAAVSDPTTGQAITAFVVLSDSAGREAGAAATSSEGAHRATEERGSVVSREGSPGAPARPGGAVNAKRSEDIAAALRNHVTREIGPIARPADIIFCPDVPKTRSGKIMRRLLTQLYEGSPLGDTTSLTDPTVCDAIRDLLDTHKETQ